MNTRILRLPGILTLAFTALSAALAATVGPVAFEHFGPEDGLPHNTVNDILEDQQGFIWLATDSGLSRYDGYEFVGHRIAPGAGSNVLMGLLEDSAGRLWIASETGIWLFDRVTLTFSRPTFETPHLDRDGYAQALLEDSRGAIWAGIGRSIARLDPESSAFREVPFPEAGVERIWSLAEDGNGTIWTIAGDSGGLRNELVEVAPSGDRPPRRAALKTRFQTVVLTDSAGRLCTGPLQAAVGLDDIPLRPISLPGTYFLDLAEEDNGAAWIGSAAGLYRLDQTLDRPQRIVFRSGAPSWQQEQIRALEIDRAGGLWMGTLGGLFYRDAHSKPFRHWRHDPQDPASLSADAISDIVAGNEGALWIGTFGGGLNRVDPETGRAERFRHDPRNSTSLPGDNLWTLAVDSRGRIWSGGGVPAVLEPASGRFVKRPLPTQDAGGAPPIGASALRPGLNGSIWLGTHRRGLFRLRPQATNWDHVPDLDVYSLAHTPGGAVWIGQVGGISRLDPETLQHRRFALTTSDGTPLDGVEVLDLAEDDEQIWIGTTAGLGRFDRQSRTFELPIAAGQLPGTVVFSIQPDGQGRLWLGTNQGLARFDPHSAGGVRVYGPADGLGNVEFNRHSRFRAADGTIYMGGMTGVTIFHPAEIHDNPYAPPVVLTAIDALGPEGEMSFQPYGLERLELPPLTSVVTFTFTALSYTRAGRNRYAYRLDGFDEDWIDGGHERSVRYTNLPPGAFSFRVRAANNDGLWNEEGVRLPIVLKAAFWQTTWFKLLILTLVATTLYLAYRLRLRRLIEIERMRLRIAGDLHDELGSEIAGIALASSRLAARDYLEPRDRHRLEDVEVSSRKVAQGLRDIVWYINPEHDNWRSIESRMRSLAAHLLDGLDYLFEIDLDEAEGRIDMAGRRNLYLIYKEVLNNVARHSGASRVEIRLQASGESILLEVIDDGVGFDPDSESDGTGLGSIRRRAAGIGALIDIASAPGNGTRVRVEARMT